MYIITLKHKMDKKYIYTIIYQIIFLREWIFHCFNKIIMIEATIFENLYRN